MNIKMMKNPKSIKMSSVGPGLKTFRGLSLGLALSWAALGIFSAACSKSNPSSKPSIQQAQKETVDRKTVTAKIASSQTLSIPSPVPDMTVGKNNPAASKTAVSSTVLSSTPSLAEGTNVKSYPLQAPTAFSDRSIEKYSSSPSGALAGSDTLSVPNAVNPSGTQVFAENTPPNSNLGSGNLPNLLDLAPLSNTNVKQGRPEGASSGSSASPINNLGVPLSGAVSSLFTPPGTGSVTGTGGGTGGGSGTTTSGSDSSGSTPQPFALPPSGVSNLTPTPLPLGLPGNGVTIATNDKGTSGGTGTGSSGSGTGSGTGNSGTGTGTGGTGTGGSGSTPGNPPAPNPTPTPPASGSGTGNNLSSSSTVAALTLASNSSSSLDTTDSIDAPPPPPNPNGGTQNSNPPNQPTATHQGGTVVDPMVTLVNVGSPFTVFHTDSPSVDYHFTTAPYLAEDKDLHCFPDLPGNPMWPVFLQNPGPQVRFEYKSSTSEDYKPSTSLHDEDMHDGLPHLSEIFPVNYCGQTSNHNDLAVPSGIESDGSGFQYACKGYVRITATLITTSAADGSKKHYRAQKEFGCKDIYDKEKRAPLKDGDIYPKGAIPIVRLLLQEYQPQLEMVAPSILLNSALPRSTVLKLPPPQ